MNITSISWTEKTWNPISGCTPISEGCQNCYAKRMAQRLRGRCGYPADEPFRVTLHPDRLDEPLRMRKPARIFVCSMGDLFHDDVPDEFIDTVFAVMALAPQHVFMVLTKRPERMRDYFDSRAQLCDDGLPEPISEQVFWPGFKIRGVRSIDQRWKCIPADYDGPYLVTPEEWVWQGEGKPFAWPLPNVRLGVTAENQARADERIPVLLEVPAAVRFVSCEPLLGPIDLTQAEYGPNPPAMSCFGFTDGFGYEAGLQWIIAGGETGPNARPMHPDWVRSLRDQCQVSPTPFHFKSWGEWASVHELRCGEQGIKGKPWHNFDPDTALCKVGAKAAGRLLDGREWNEYPEVSNND